MPIRLLEDEVDIIKQILAEDVLNYSIYVAGIIPVQVEKVTGQTFEHLPPAFGQWIQHLDYLTHSRLEMAEHQVSEGEFARLFFFFHFTGICNHHEEKLLVCQIYFSTWREPWLRILRHVIFPARQDQELSVQLEDRIP